MWNFGFKMVSVEQAHAVEEFVRCQFGDDYKQLQGAERLYHCINNGHPDKKKSCSVNMELCVYNCHGCEYGGSFYQLAKAVGWENPHQFIPKNGNSTIVQYGSLPSKPKPKPKKKPTFTMKELADIQKGKQSKVKGHQRGQGNRAHTFVSLTFRHPWNE